MDWDFQTLWLHPSEGEFFSTLLQSNLGALSKTVLGGILNFPQCWDKTGKTYILWGWPQQVSLCKYHNLRRWGELIKEHRISQYAKWLLHAMGGMDASRERRVMTPRMSLQRSVSPSRVLPRWEMRPYPVFCQPESARVGSSIMTRNYLILLCTHCL